jgi:hypothetical protein
MNHVVPMPVNVSTWLSLRFERGTRYYQLHLEQDLWGRLDTHARERTTKFAAGPAPDDLARIF